MASGTVKWFDSNRGYGFIRPEQGEDVFVHVSAVQASGLQSLQDGQAVEFDIQQGPKGPQPPTCGHGRHPRRADAPLPPATLGERTRPMGISPCLQADATRAGQRRRLRCDAAGRAGGRDADGEGGAAMRPAVAGLPAGPRPAPHLQGRHGAVPGVLSALAAGGGSAVPLARPGPAMGPGRQGAGGVPLPRRPSVGGAAGGDRGGPLRPSRPRSRPVRRPQQTSPRRTARRVAATLMRQGPHVAMGRFWGASLRATTASTGHVEQADHGPFGAWFQTWMAGVVVDDGVVVDEHGHEPGMAVRRW
jgi:CspA family cold shock protein